MFRLGHTAQVETSLVRSYHVNSIRSRSGQDRLRQGKDRSEHVSSGKDKFRSGQVRSCQDNSDYVMSRRGQVRTDHVKVRLRQV